MTRPLLPWRLGYDCQGGTSVSVGSEYGLDFDELCLAESVHLERLEPRHFFLSVGDRAIWFSVRRDGTASITHEETRQLVSPKQRKKNLVALTRARGRGRSKQ